MARQKEKEVEQEIDVSSAPVKKMTFAARWFQDHAVNNKTDLKMVCDLTNRSAYEQFKLCIPSGNTEIYAVVFYGTFMSLLDFIRKKQKTYSQFTIRIAQNLNIGYINGGSIDDEKIGNFQPVMEYLSTNRTVVNSDTDGYPNSAISEALKKKNKSELDRAVKSELDDKYLMWKSLNTKTSADYYKEIQADAYNRLQNEYNISLRTDEAIIPLFCIFLDHIANVLKVKYKEAQGTDVSEVSMNVLGLFDVFYSFNDDEQEVIEFQPNIAMKLALKNDDVAGGDMN